jgi:hypothetical protein
VFDWLVFNKRLSKHPFVQQSVDSNCDLAGVGCGVLSSGTGLKTVLKCASVCEV